MKIDNARGSAAVGFAFVLPILAIIFASITELGIMYYNKQVITNATRVAAREGSISWTSGNHNPSQTAIDYCNSRMISLGDMGDADTSPISGENVTVKTSGPSGAEKITVTISYKYTLLLNRLVGIEDDDKTSWINAETTMQVAQSHSKTNRHDES